MASATVSAHLPPSARLAACAVLAVILNAGAIGIVSRAASSWAGVAPLADDPPQRGVMVLLPAPAVPSTAWAIQPAAGSPEPVITTRQSRLNQPKARTTAVAVGAPQPVMFYPFREVDNAAYPESDWNLDVDMLDQLGLRRLVFEVMVSDRGVVVGCTVLEPTDLSDEVKRKLEARLSETTLLPAQRAGQLVASVRRIELVVADAPPESTADNAGSSPAHRP